MTVMSLRMVVTYAVIKACKFKNTFTLNILFETYSIYVQFTFSSFMKDVLQNIFQFYYQGFKSMTVGKRLWTIIIIKLFVIFFVLKFFFFPNFLNTNFKTDEQRSNHVIEQLTK